MLKTVSNARIELPFLPEPSPRRRTQYSLTKPIFPLTNSAYQRRGLLADLLHKTSKECEKKLDNESRAMQQAELEASRDRRQFEFHARQKRRMELDKKSLVEVKKSVFARVEAKCQMWRDRATRVEKTLDKEQNRNREGRIVLYLSSGWHFLELSRPRFWT